MIQVVSWDSLLLSNFSKLSQFIAILCVVQMPLPTEWNLFEPFTLMMFLGNSTSDFLMVRNLLLFPSDHQGHFGFNLFD